MIGADEVKDGISQRSEGRRTVTQIDDVLLRTVGRLAPITVGLIAMGNYLVFGVALPLLLNFSRVETIVWGAFGALWAGLIILCLFVTAAQAAYRRHLIEWTTDLRKLDATEFEWLVGEVLRRERWNVTEVGRQGAPMAASTFAPNAPARSSSSSASAGPPTRSALTRSGRSPARRQRETGARPGLCW